MDIPTGGLTVYMVGNLHVVVPAKVMSLWIKETYEGFYFIYFMLKQLDNDKKMQFKQFIKFLSEAGMLSEQNARNLTTVFIQSASEIRQRR
jgi:DNA-binding transcriptional regulator/RsmH inhibitor MraZ